MLSTQHVNGPIWCQCAYQFYLHMCRGVKLCNHGRTMWVSAYSYIHNCICDHRHTMHVQPRVIWMPTMSSLHHVIANAWCNMLGFVANVCSRCHATDKHHMPWWIALRPCTTPAGGRRKTRLLSSFPLFFPLFSLFSFLPLLTFSASHSEYLPSCQGLT